jgi:hypothetical protein
MGAAAGTKKDFREFNTPFARAARLIKKRKGNIILVSLTVRSNFSGLLMNPGAMTETTYGANNIPSKQIMERTDKTKASTADASLLASSLPSFVRVSVKTGINAADMEPSAKSSLNRFGILCAIKKASVEPVAPNILASNISLTKPRIRLPVVAIDICPAAFVRLRLSSIKLDFPVPVMLKNGLFCYRLYCVSNISQINRIIIINIRR